MRRLKVYIYYILLSAAAMRCGYAAAAGCGRAAMPENEVDSVVTVEEIRVTALKQGMVLADRPVAASIFGRAESERHHIAALKNLSQNVPNLHIPDYGSRMTSSIYVRGLGARIDQPVMGLNVDNVPMMNKDAYDAELADIDRIEVLRGPQSTLYGRNTMGGVVNVYTISPLDWQGVRAGAEYSSGNTYKIRASLYSAPSERFGVAAGGYYTSSDGFYTNLHTGRLCDWEHSAGGRFKLQWRPSRQWAVDNTAAVSVVRQGGYPYAYAGEDIVENGQTVIAHGEIRYDAPSAYRRTSVSDALTLKHTGGRISVASITSYQYLDDRMNMDNDFLPQSYFTLMQQRREHAVTEDLVIRPTVAGDRYNWIVGAFGFYRHTRMAAPVEFCKDGVQRIIVDNIVSHTGIVPQFPEIFPLEDYFTMPAAGVALYHESNLTAGRWQFTAGLRVDCEHTSLRYRSSTTETCSIGTTVIEPFTLADRLPQSFVEVLPKFAVLLRVGRRDANRVWLSASKGYKAGGFNTQMFSEVLQTELMKRMHVYGSKSYTVDEVVAYKPERSWNFELGTHLETAAVDGCFASADVSLFYISCTDQQLTVFPRGAVTGRMMTNAGRTRSLGAEFSGRATLRRLTAAAAYGFTDARFTEYLYNEADGLDFAGNRIPYAPQHTLSASLTYTIPVGAKWIDAVALRVATDGAGAISWNEENTVRQPFYALLGVSVRLEHRHWSLELWGRNLTDKRYGVFWFKSVGNEFMQYARPRTLGVTLNCNF